MTLRLCGFCQRPYDEKVPLTLSEREQLNVALFVTGPAVNEDRPICPTCYENVIGSAARSNNESSLNVGHSNCGPGNFLLKHTYG